MKVQKSAWAIVEFLIGVVLEISAAGALSIVEAPGVDYTTLRDCPYSPKCW